MKHLKAAASKAAVILFTLMLVGTMLTGSAVAQNAEINYDEGPNLVITEDSVTIAEHDRAEMASVLEYYDDNGEVTTLPATINDSASENPIEVDYTKIDAEALSTFPREDVNASAMDETEWTKDAAGSAGTGTIAAGSVGDVSAVEFSASSQTSGDTMVFSYSNFSSLSDADKRVLFSTFEIASAGSGATVELAAVEDDGDEKSIELYNASGDSSNVDDVATTTGTGFVGQVKLTELTVAGSGDGDLSSIDSIEVRIHDEAATVRMTGLDAEKKALEEIGEHYNATSEETETFYEVTSPGAHNLTEIWTLDTWTTDATVHDLVVKNLRYSAEYAPADDVSVSYTDATNYQYPSKVEVYERVSVPAAIDLSHSGLQLEATQNFVEPRYVIAEYAEGEGDVEPENATYSDVSGQYSSQGDTHILDDTVTVGTEYDGHWMILLNDDDVKDLQDVDQGPISGPISESSGGILGSIGSWIAGAFASLLGIFGVNKRWG